MASQAQIYRKKIAEYERTLGHDPAVLAQMRQMLDFANTVDPVLVDKAVKILNA